MKLLVRGDPRSSSPPSSSLSERNEADDAPPILIAIVQHGAPGMTAKRSLDLDLSVDHLMRTWPDTVGVFLRRRMLCVGCPIGPFHSVADACREHSIDEEEFRQELRVAIGEVPDR